MLDHISLGVTNLIRMKAFYDAIFAPLGYQRLWDTPAGAGYGRAGTDDDFALFQPAEPHPMLAAEPGFHVAFTATSRAAVDAFHAAALAHGGQDEGAPGPRVAYGSRYYAAFVRDPDGHKLEAVYHAAAA